MMKNSKLSKLLVAGVSVAMLASALAPMAFAEDSTAAAEADYNLQVNVMVVDEESSIIDGGKKGEMEGWNESPFASTYFAKKYFTNDDTTWDNQTVDLSDYVPARGYKVDSWWVTKNTTNVEKEADVQNPLYVKFLAGLTASTDNSVLVCKVKKLPSAILTYTETATVDKEDNGKVTGPHEDEEGVDLTNGMELLLDDEITLPTFDLGNDYTDVSFKVVSKVNGSVQVTKDEIAQGSVVKMADLGFSGSESTDNLTIEITATFTGAKKIKLQILTNNSNKIYVVGEKDTEEVAFDDSTYSVVGISAADKSKVNKFNTAQSLVYGESENMPAVQVVKTADGKVVDQYAFDHWEVVDNSNNMLSNGKDKANGFVLENNVFDTEDFLADSNAVTTIVVYPVFNKADDVITYSTASTPNDKVVKYVNGVAEATTVVIGDDMKTREIWDGGQFTDEKTGVVSYYSSKKVGGKWVIDTTVNGLVDGFVFDKGVQDTEAYGLYKVSDSDPFFYLVSDGVYKDDYQGIWVDEDGSIYNLINGCTSDVPFTGIVEKDGWATSVKDSMVDNKANGFILYGDTQYWFINGTCNLNETEAVREHTDGNFYYTVGAKIDFTFNGECNGHTFVNGVASK